MLTAACEALGLYPDAAELVACECVVLAETKDHFDWELTGECAKSPDGEARAALTQAYEAVETAQE